MKKLCLLVIILIAGAAKPCVGQNKKMDSLQNLLNIAKDDTTRLKLYLALSYECNTKDNLKYAEPALQLADKLLSNTIQESFKKNIIKRKTFAYRFIGEYYSETGNVQKALDIFQKSLMLSREVNFKEGIGVALYKIGLIYQDQDYKVQALENFLKGLPIFYELKDTSSITNALMIIGKLYGDLHNVHKSLEYFKKALAIYEVSKTKYQANLIFLYGNIGAMYKDNKDLQNALVYYKKSLDIAETLKYMEVSCRLLINLGNVNRILLNYNEALIDEQKALKTAEEINSKELKAWCYANMAEIYRDKKEFKKAIDYGERALSIGKNQINIANVRDFELIVSKTDSCAGNYKEAYQHYQSYIKIRDKLNSGEVGKAITKEKIQSDYERQNVIAKAEQEKKNAVAIEEKKRQLFVIYSVAALLVIVIIFSGLLYKRFRLTNKQKQIIEIKSKEIEEKQHEIIDSITYAKRLQQAILPSLAAVKEQLPNSFVYYQPKDIVAGDFYWMHVVSEQLAVNSNQLTENNKTASLITDKSSLVYIAAADCTGHGVPGAMVSVVCSNALNRAVNEFNLTDTGLILDKTRELVIETFEKSDSEVKDGMDISLLRIKYGVSGSKTEIQWSGANNSLWYVLNSVGSSEVENKELIEVKADKQPIGKYSEPTPFTTHNISLPPSPSGRAGEGCTFYLFSDGYADQFSENDKKLMKKKFKDIVLSMQDLSMEEQKNKIKKVHIDWKGTMEQTDDVLVIGVKI